MAYALSVTTRIGAAGVSSVVCAEQSISAGCSGGGSLPPTTPLTSTSVGSPTMKSSITRAWITLSRKIGVQE